MSKSKQMEQFLDDLSLAMFGISRSAAILGGICVMCEGPAVDFKDDLSRKEYEISGTCQECQDQIFGSD